MGVLKVDLRILHGWMRQGQNVETDIGVTEAAEEQPRRSKFGLDWHSTSIKSKVTIDNFLRDGRLISSVGSLLICGLEMHFVNTSLETPGAYVGTQFYTSCIDNSMINIIRYLDLAIHLLCFRDECISTINQYEEYLSNVHFVKVSAKRSLSSLPQEDLVKKQKSVRGWWNPPRTTKYPPRSKPDKLFGKDQNPLKHTYSLFLINYQWKLLNVTLMNS